MKVFANLCKNEYSKICTKKIVTIFLLCIGVIIILSIFLVKKIKLSNELVQKQINSNFATKLELKDLESQRSFNQFNDIELDVKIKYYTYAINNNIILDHAKENNYYKYNLLQDIILNEINMNEKNLLTSQKEILKDKINYLISIIEEDNFEEYIRYNIKKVQSSNSSNVINDVLIEIEKLALKYEVGKYNDDTLRWKLDSLNTIKSCMEDNLISKNYKSDDKINLELYKLDNNINYNTTTNITNYSEAFIDTFEVFSFIFLILFFSVISMSNICDEYLTGGIKQLYLMPCKSYKIIISKIVVIFSLILISTIILSAIVLLISNGIYESNSSDYMYVVGTTILKIPSSIYTVLKYLSDIVPILFFVFLSIMIAVIIRNFIISIGTMFILCGVNIVFTSEFNMIAAENQVSITSQYKEFIKYLPFNNLNFSVALFGDKNIMFLKLFDINYNQDINKLFSILFPIVSSLLFLIIILMFFRKKERV